MKIGILSGLFEPYDVGGAEVVAKASAREAAERGDDVFVVTSAPLCRSGFLPRVEVRDGLRIHRYFPLNLFHYSRLFTKPFFIRALWHLIDLFNWHSFFVLRAVLKREKPDIVETHNVKGLGYLTWAAARSLRIPIAHRIHDVQLVEPSGLLMAGSEKRADDAPHRAYQALCRFLIGSPVKVVASARWLLEMHTTRGFFPNSERLVVPNPVPNFEKNPRVPRPSDAVRLLYMGQLERHKGVLFLVEALKAGMESGFLLRIAGSGSLLEALRGLVAGDPRFELVGRVEGQAFLDAFARTDILIVPSLCHENNPTVISIAQSLGVGVVASDVRGIETVPKTHLFAPSDAGALIDTIRRVKDEG